MSTRGVRITEQDLSSLRDAVELMRHGLALADNGYGKFLEVIENCQEYVPPFKITVDTTVDLASLTGRGYPGRFEAQGCRWTIDYHHDRGEFWLIEEGSEQNDYYKELPEWLQDEIRKGLEITISRKALEV